MLTKLEKGKGISDIEKPESVKGGVGFCGMNSCIVCANDKIQEKYHDQHWIWYGKSPHFTVPDPE